MSRSSVRFRQVALTILGLPGWREYKQVQGMKRNSIILFLLLALAVQAADSPGTTGFQFLKTQVGGRAAGMGGAFLAVGNDVNAIYYNPGAVATVPTRSASFTYLKHVLDFNYGFIGFVQPHLGPGHLGVGLTYMDYGNFKKTDQNGDVLGNFSANSICLAAVYALQPVTNLSLGVSAKYIRATIDTYAADAVAVDAGAMYVFPKPMLTLAAGVFNAGQPVSAFINTRDDLPMCFRVGLSKRLEHLPLLLSLVGYQYRNEKWHGVLGGEFTLTPQAFLRLGYDNIGQDLQVGGNKDRFAGASLGLGFLWRTVQLDYAFSSMGEIGSLNRFSISSSF